MGAVDSKKIKSVSMQLAKLVPSSSQFKVKPASPLEMIKEVAEQLQYEDFTYDAESAIEGDSGAWGIIKMSQAIGWVSGAEAFIYDQDGNEIQNSVIAKKASDLVKSLVGTGVVFGAGPFGAVQCGFTYPALIIMDTEAGVVYTFETEGSGC